MIRIAFLALLLFAPAVAANAQVRRLDGSATDTAALGAMLERLRAEANVTGMAVSVFNHNKPVFSKTFGYSDFAARTKFTPHQVMYGASFSKAVFAYIVMQLVQENKIDLDKPLVTYLDKPLPDYTIPGWKRGYQDLRNDKRYERITARMCMSHTAGFPNWRWFEPDGKLKFIADPGTRYSYSGEGMYLLQFVIEQVTGKDYESLARERVFLPLGMVNTSYMWRADFAQKLVLGHNAKNEPYEFMQWKEAGCAGTMCTSLEDYTRFFTALMQHEGLTDKIFKQMLTPQVRIRSVQQFGPLARKDSSLNDGIQLSYGLGVGLLNTPYGPAFFKEGHDDGWGHYSIAFPKTGTGIVIMTNSDNGESLFKEILARTIGDTFTPWYWENYLPYTAAFKALYDANRGKHYRTLTFKQTTERYRNDSLVSTATWKEYLEFPSKLRIDMGPAAGGNAALFIGDTTYTFRKGALLRKSTQQNDLIFLLGGMYFYPYEESKAKLSALGFNPVRGFASTWNGRPVDVIGASAEGEQVNQLWIDREKQVVLRIVEYSGGHKQETVMDKHVRLGKSWAETLVNFYVDGKLLQAEKYFDVEADKTIDPKLFDAYRFGK